MGVRHGVLVGGRAYTVEVTVAGWGHKAYLVRAASNADASVEARRMAAEDVPGRAVTVSNVYRRLGTEPKEVDET